MLARNRSVYLDFYSWVPGGDLLEVVLIATGNEANDSGGASYGSSEHAVSLLSVGDGRGGT